MRSSWRTSGTEDCSFKDERSFVGSRAFLQVFEPKGEREASKLEDSQGDIGKLTVVR